MVEKTMQRKPLDLGRGSKPTLILISGRMEAGKSVLANGVELFYRKELQSFILVRIEHFASKLKEVAERLGWDGEKDERGRKLLQNLGRVGREYDRDIYCRNVHERIMGSLFLPQIVLVDDWRFPNEFDFLHSTDAYDIIRIRIIRHPMKYNEDISENSLPEYDRDETGIPNNMYDLVLLNDGTKQDLIDEFLSWFKERNG